MELPRAYNQVHVGQTVQQLLTPALGHATQEAEHRPGRLRRSSATRFSIFRSAFCSAMSRTLQVLSRMTSAVASAAGQGVALGHELRGHRLAVALVHLATVSFNINTGHSCNLRNQFHATTIHLPPSPAHTKVPA